MRILITGGTGYVGFHVALALVRFGHSVKVVARGISNPDRARQLADAGVEVVLADLSESRDLLVKVSPRGIDIIIHGVSSFLEPAGVGSLTVRSMEEAIRFAMACPSLSLFIDLSNNLPYGDTRTAEWGAGEEFVCRPNTIHGANKLAAEQILRDSGLPCLILRISQIYGGVGSSFDWIVLDQIRRGKLPLPGNGRNRVDLVHIDDVCQAVVASVLKRPIGEVINVCSGDTSLTQGELFAFLADCLKVKRPVKIPYPVALAYAFLAERLALMRAREIEVVPDMVRVMAMDRVLDTCKAVKLLGYRPEYPESLAGLEASYADVFAGQDELFVPAHRLDAVRGNV